MTNHSIERTKQRAKLKEGPAIKMIQRALLRGQNSANFPAREREYLISRESAGTYTLCYSGYCFVFSNDNNCITMFPIPSWFGKRYNFRGKTLVKNPRKYSKLMHQK